MIPYKFIFLLEDDDGGFVQLSCDSEEEIVLNEVRLHYKLEVALRDWLLSLSDDDRISVLEDHDGYINMANLESVLNDAIGLERFMHREGLFNVEVCTRSLRDIAFDDWMAHDVLIDEDSVIEALNSQEMSRVADLP